MSANITPHQSAVITLPPDLDQRLTALANTTGKSKAFYALEAIESYLEDLEDAADAEEVLARIERGEEKVISAREMERRFGLGN